MDAAYITALAALAGSTIGGLTSFATTWLSQREQFRSQQLSRERSKREELYTLFIEEAARLYADAYEHSKAEAAQLVNLYALVSKMRVVSEPKIIESADDVVRVIVATYLAPNKTLRDVSEILDNDAMNPLREFSNACRQELQGHWS
jgi:hypothetical protein